MNSPGMRRDGAQQLDALPLRSLTAVWIFAGVLGACVLAFALRGAWSGAGREASAKQSSAARGPSKLEVKQRQEHIALTQRALELAAKERKAAQAASSAAAAPGVPAPGASSPSPAAASPASGSPGPASSEVKEKAEPSAAAPAATDQPASAASPPASTPAANPPASKPAAGGLDELRAGVGVDFE